MDKKLTRILKGEIVSSVFYILFGLCLVIIPQQTVNIICKVIFGILMIGNGIYHVWIYAREKENATIMDLFTGVIIFVLGTFLFFTPQIVIKILPYLLGSFILVDSIWVLKGCRKLRKAENGKWKLFLIESLVFIVLAIILIVYRFEKVMSSAIFAGGVMLANGVADIILLILLRQGMKKAAAQNTQETQTEEEEPIEQKEEKSKRLHPEWPDNFGAKFFKKNVQAGEESVEDNSAEEKSDEKESLTEAPVVYDMEVSGAAEDSDSCMLEDSEKTSGSEEEKAVLADNGTEASDSEEELEEWRD